jgi:O-antigen/teichoic acid export membrane protein
MVNKKTISVNILFSILQIFITGLSYYFLYKFLLQKIGTDLMGVWAIVLSVSSSANIANFGIGTGVVRYTAKFKVNNELHEINQLLHTSLLFIALVFGTICAVLFIVAPFWLHSVIAGNFYNDAIQLIPYSLACLLVNALSGIFLSCIDGLQKNFIRSILYIVSFSILLGSSYVLVPRYGLMGVAYAQFIQSVFLFIGSAVMLKVVFKPLQLFPLKWNKQIFKNIFSFGIQEQIISICQLCFDPFTKSMLGSFGSLTTVTYYEMANRLVTQLRGFLVSANQVFIPVFTSTSETSAEGTHQLYKKIFSINFLLSLLWLSFIIAAVIPISKIWIGAVNNEFITVTIFLAFAYWCNIVISPAYFANMGSATLKDNVTGNILIAVLNVILCFILGYFFKGFGVVAGWSIALAFGSLYVMIKYHHRHSFNRKLLLTQADLKILLFCMMYCAVSFGLFNFKNSMNVWLMFAIDALLFVFVLTAVFYIHPVSKFLLSIIKKKP